jgi:hypothetical protein
MWKFLKIFGLVTIVLLPALVMARIGVGVGNGKIQAGVYKAGAIHELPALPVINTGDEPADYGVSVEFHEGIPQLRPDRSWFSFKPDELYLEPGKLQNVKVILTLPVRTPPGDYFCYLEAHPVSKKVEGAGGTSIGVAAATRLYFSVAPANIFQGVYYRLASLFARWAPWSWVVLSVIGLASLIAFLRQFISLDIGISKRKK